MEYNKDELQSKTTLDCSAYQAAMSQFDASFVEQEPEIGLGTQESRSNPPNGIKGSYLPPEHPRNGEENRNVDPNDWKKRHSYYKGYFSPDSFGTYDEVMAALKKPVSSYSLIFEHPSVQKSFTPPKPKPNVQNKYSVDVKAKPEKRKPVSEKSIWKNGNRFPQNVKSLTTTGMFDGVPVRYILASQEKLRGVVKGGDYLCGCESCNYSKTFNACEFEHHAGCKTSHANNHIRFLNGKSIHEIVQELKNTPDDMLADAILTVTGSPINNQSAYRAWKESFEAATRKVQHV